MYIQEIFVRNICDGDPRGWAIKYSEILLNDLKQPLPKKWLRAKDVPEIKLESGLNNLSQWVLIVEDGNIFRFVTRDHIEDTDRLCVPYVTIRSDLSK